MQDDQFELSQGDYAPDPERDTDLLVDGFLRRIADIAREHGLAGDAVAEVQRRQAELATANTHRVVDEPARHNLRLTVLLLAGYQVLRPLLGRDEAMSAVRAAFIEPLGEQVRMSTKALLDTATDPFAAMVAVSKSRERYAFGSGFAFEHPVEDESRFYSDVHRCFYHDVLVGESAAELTPVMCAFDANWIEAIDPPRHGFTFDRATTIGTGGSHCPFHFRRTGTPPDTGESE